MMKGVDNRNWANNRPPCVQQIVCELSQRDSKYEFEAVGGAC